MGIIIAVAVVLHIIPEGNAVSVPILYSTGSYSKAFIYSFLSGLAETVGAIIGFTLLLPFLSPAVLYSTLAFVAGVMVYRNTSDGTPL
jgi:ZIP family zinc transporter